MDKSYLQVQKTARYFTHNVLSDQTKTILILVHGYAQTAEHIIEYFSGLNNSYFVIAPEGLNRFYSRGFGGTPVASWMTSLERETEIADYIQYLDALYAHIKVAASDVKIVVLGFSQGVSTASRWIEATSNRIDAFMLVAGEIAVEMQQQLPHKMRWLRKAYFIGNADNLVRPEKVVLMKNLLGTDTLFYTFEGRHEINAQCVALVAKVIDKLLN